MISKQEVEHIAKLARLELSCKEIEKMQKALSTILDYVEILNKLDVSNVELSPSFSIIENIMREDIVKKGNSDSIGSIGQQFPSKEGNHLKVKGVFN